MPAASMLTYDSIAGPVHAIGVDLSDVQKLAKEEKRIKKYSDTCAARSAEEIAAVGKAISDGHSKRTDEQKLDASKKRSDTLVKKYYRYRIVDRENEDIILLDDLNGAAISEIFGIKEPDNRNYNGKKLAYNFTACRIVNVAEMKMKQRKDVGVPKDDSNKISYNVIAIGKDGVETGTIFHEDVPERTIILFLGKPPTTRFYFSNELNLKNPRKHKEHGYIKITLCREGSDGSKRQKFS